MKMSCKPFSRVVLIILNLLLLITSLLIISLGIALVVAPEKIDSLNTFLGLDVHTYTNSSESLFLTIIQGLGIFMIFLGVIVVIVATFGLLAAYYESYPMLLVYSIFL